MLPPFLESFTHMGAYGKNACDAPLPSISNDSRLWDRVWPFATPEQFLSLRDVKMLMCGVCDNSNVGEGVGTSMRGDAEFGTNLLGFAQGSRNT
jgi:hypothetical protein